MRAIWIILIAIVIVLVFIIVVYFGWIEPVVSSEAMDVEERYTIDPSDEYRVFRITTSKDAILAGIDDVASHDVDGDNHYLYLKKNVAYNVVVNGKSKHAVIWGKS